MFVFLFDLLGPEGKKISGFFPLKLLVCSSPFATKLFPYGTTSLGDDFTPCHLPYVFLEVGEFPLDVIGSLPFL